MDLGPYIAKPQASADSGFITENLKRSIEEAGGRVIDPRPSFINLQGDRYIIELNGTCLYSDSNHLSKKGSVLMLLPLLRESLTLSE